MIKAIKNIQNSKVVQKYQILKVMQLKFLSLKIKINFLAKESEL
jgi:hypothetical protein